MAVAETKPCWINENLPSPVASSYSAKGLWEEFRDINTYISGRQWSKKALVVIYDVFGPSPQVLQGVDRLSEHLNTLVIMPDFFKGNAPDHDEFVKDRAKGRPKLQEFMKAHADIDTNTKTLLEIMPDIQSRFPSVESWGVFGLCWGGKVAVTASIAEKNPFKASGQTHPARLAVEDAEALTTPHICMPSKDEPSDVVDEYEKILAKKEMGTVVRFRTMFHGWMGARADLNDQENIEGYQRGYAVAAEFFAKNL